MSSLLFIKTVLLFNPAYHLQKQVVFNRIPPLKLARKNPRFYTKKAMLIPTALLFSLLLKAVII